jgi:hypothetical protein
VIAPRLFIHLQGGLGNQLFQIFTTIAYGFTNTIKVVFPLTKTLPDGIERPTYWDSFLKSLIPFTCEHLKYKMTNEQLYKFQLFRENGYNFREIPIVYNDTMLYGYWQSYKYFDDLRDKIFQMIRLQQFKDSIKNEYSRYFDEENALISMHFRLGDYKYNQHCHPILPYKYYEKSTKKKKRLKYDVIIYIVYNLYIINVLIILPNDFIAIKQ